MTNCIIPRIKICGITSEKDARLAIELGVDALGFVFYKKSLRNVTIEQISWLKTLPPFVQIVALFVNPNPKLVNDILINLPIDLCQFHGNESPEFCRQFNTRYIKAAPMQNLTQKQSEKYIEKYNDACGFILDNYGDRSIGGSGTTFDWQKIPRKITKPIIIAGGLNKNNVSKIISNIKPYGIDVSSGVETSAGIKSAKKIAEFINAVKNY